MKTTRKNTHKARRLKQLVTGLVCLALLVSLAPLMAGAPASAFTSLQHIESLVSSLQSGSDSFVILEIVPEAGSGSIGYYIDGCEPTANWKAEAAMRETPDARRAYAESLFTDLKNAGLLGAGDNQPLAGSTVYTETYPWESTSGTKLTLNKAETVEVHGTFTEKSKGDYLAYKEYSLSDTNGDGVGDLGGQYNQKILRFVWFENYVGSLTYYYNPSFELVYNPDDGVLPDPAVYSGKALYTLPDEDGAHYLYAGIVGIDGFAMEKTKKYYAVSAVGAPQTAPSGYAAVADEYERVDSGYFNYAVTGYEYLGGGKGDFSFSSGGPSVDITTKTVYYSGGYKNNNWFLRYVLDRDDETQFEGLSECFQVISTTPSKVNEEINIRTVEEIDLIVLSAGLNRKNIDADRTAALGPGNDLSVEKAKAIYNAVGESLAPVIVDYRLAVTGGPNDHTNLRSLARLLITRSLAGTLGHTDSFGDLAQGLDWKPATISDADKNFVRKNVLCYNPISALPALATPKLKAPLNTTNALGFEEVSAEIAHENFLRRHEDELTEDLLEEEVTLGGVIRYIINFSGQRIVTPKTAISVLEIQPGCGKALTAATVRSWTGNTVNAADIKITSMSTAELIGKIEDLIENYDLVYLGADLTGVGRNNNTDYTDNAMDGLIYTNIGDTYVSGLNLSGLLDRDYHETTKTNNVNVIKNTDASKTFRFSGNDLTASKVNQLMDFAAAGYPIVIADNLVKPAPGYNGFSFTATVAKSGLTLTASAAATVGTLPSESVLPRSYAWFKDGVRIPDSGATCTPDANESGIYSCAITIGGQTAISNTATVTVTNQLYSATPASLSTAVTQDITTGSTNYTIKITRSGSDGSNPRTYEISVTPQPGSTPSYQWQRRQNSTWSNIPGATSSSYTTPDTNNDRHRCVVTINGSSVNSRWATRSQYQDNNQNTTLSAPIITTVSALVDVTPGQNGVTLRARRDPTIGTSASYQWTRDDHNISTSDTISQTQVAGVYRCRVRFRYPNSNSTQYTTYTNSYTVTGGTTISVTVNSNPGAPAVVPKAVDTFSPNPTTVDFASQVYDFINRVGGYANAFTQAGAPGKSATLVQYLNLSKPQINLTDYPVAYTGPAGPTLTGSEKILSYTFTIENATDATPSATRYDCRLFLDLNSDGRYKPVEEITDIVIRRADGSGELVSPNIYNEYALSAGVPYTLTRKMPSGFAGIIPWKLEVVKIGAPHIHASQNNYTRIKGAKTNINILQILHSGDTGLDLTKNGTYQDLFNQVEDFNLNITTVKAGSIAAAAGGASKLTAYLGGYDMLVLGFQDMYQELTKDEALAVVAYIDTGKAVLFTHDTTSFVNLPNVHSDGYPTTSGGTRIPNNWGYYFNTILRDAVSLDRYGVTNPSYGITKYRTDIKGSTGTGQTINVASSTPLTQAQADVLIGAGYSVAYKPVSYDNVSASTQKTILQDVQGFTSYNLKRYSNINSDDGITHTEYVSQVNEGQITTYPFDLNLKGFGRNTSTATTMRIATSHEQYYQLNMNSDDIVVWYCLANGRDNAYNNLPNDAVNAYYIYNVGNVTYSGAGHSGNSVSTEEAKLFINTMIAAYRTNPEAPTVFFTNDKTGRTTATHHFFTNEFTGSGMSDELLERDFPADDPSRQLFFRVSDPNLNAEKTIKASLYYSAPSISGGSEQGFGEPVKRFDETDEKLYKVDGDSKVDELTGGLVYYFYIPDEALALLASEDTNKVVKIYIKVQTEIDDTILDPGIASVELRQLGLFTLR